MEHEFSVPRLSWNIFEYKTALHLDIYISGKHFTNHTELNQLN